VVANDVMIVMNVVNVDSKCGTAGRSGRVKECELFEGQMIVEGNIARVSLFWHTREREEMVQEEDEARSKKRWRREGRDRDRDRDIGRG